MCLRCAKKKTKNKTRTRPGSPPDAKQQPLPDTDDRDPPQQHKSPTKARSSAKTSPKSAPKSKALPRASRKTTHEDSGSGEAASAKLMATQMTSKSVTRKRTGKRRQPTEADHVHKQIDKLASRPWFHGFITDMDTEHILHDKALGSFLVTTAWREVKFKKAEASPSSWDIDMTVKKMTERQPTFMLHLKGPDKVHKVMIERADVDGESQWQLRHNPDNTAADINGLIKMHRKKELTIKVKIKKKINKTTTGTNTNTQTQTTSLSEGAAKKFVFEFVDRSIQTPIGPQPWEYHAEQLVVGKVLGAGAYGTVSVGTLTIDGSPVQVAVKQAKEEENTPKYCRLSMNEMLKEASTMHKFDHANVVRYVGVVALREPCYFLMEFISGGSLESFLQRAHKRGTPLSTAVRTRMIVDAAKGLEYLHSLNCIHRDLATRNCLIDKTSDPMVVKLSDFGLTRTDSVYKRDVFRDMPIRWTAPEVFNSQQWTTQSDVFSLGVLMWEVFTNAKKPYEAMRGNEVIQKVQDGHRLDTPSRMPDSIDSVMRRCWTVKPDRRPEMSEVVTLMMSVLQKLDPTTSQSDRVTQQPTNTNTATHTQTHTDHNLATGTHTQTQTNTDRPQTE